MNRIPESTVHLGTVVELVTEDRGERTTWPEARGFQILTNPDAMERAPGRARLFLCKGRIQKTAPNQKRLQEASETWERWHRRHGPELVGGMYDLPDEIAEPIGRAISLTYRSDKWRPRGNKQDWIHDFTEGKPPKVYVDNKSKPRAFVLTGGDVSITERGIA